MIPYSAKDPFSTISLSSSAQPVFPPSHWNCYFFMKYILAMEYYLVIKKNKIRPFAATGMNLEIIILNKVSQKDKYHMISLICGIQNIIKMTLSTKQKQTQRADFCQERGGWSDGLGVWG